MLRRVRVLGVTVLAVAMLTGCGVFGSGSTGSSPAPTVTPRSGPASTQHDIAYAKASAKQTLDLYLPAGDGSMVFPIVVLVHGGGFFSGSAFAQADRANFLASKGFAVAAINYRLSADATFPAAVQDATAAVRYVRANAPGWGVDPKKIAIWGTSAGGYLASMVGATGGRDTEFTDTALGNGSVSSKVSAVVSWYGPADFATMDEQAVRAGCGHDATQHGVAQSPESRFLGETVSEQGDKVRQSSVLTYLRSADSLPPYLLVHGTADCTVPPGQSQQLYDALQAKSAQVTRNLVDGAGHEDSKIVDEQTRPTIQFLRSALGIKDKSVEDGSSPSS